MYNYAVATLLRQSQAFSVPLSLLAGNVLAAAGFNNSSSLVLAGRVCGTDGIRTKEERKKP